MGTSEVTIFALKELQITDEMFAHKYSISPHCSNRLYRVFSSMQACGASIEWFLTSIGISLVSSAATAGIDKYTYLDRLAEDCGNSGQLLYYPLIRGSLENSNAGGLFTGIKDFHRIEHFAKALLDGLCCEFTWQTEACLDILGTRPQKVYVSGGPSCSDYLMQRKADISGFCVEVPDYKEAACYGASCLAAIGAGDLNFEDLIKRNKRASRIFPVTDSDISKDIYGRYKNARLLVLEL
jgi:L-xylulokinase